FLALQHAPQQQADNHQHNGNLNQGETPLALDRFKRLGTLHHSLHLHSLFRRLLRPLRFPEKICRESNDSVESATVQSPETMAATVFSEGKMPLSTPAALRLSGPVQAETRFMPARRLYPCICGR